MMYSILLFCRFERCFLAMVICIIVGLVFVSCSVMVSGFVLMVVVLFIS